MKKTIVLVILFIFPIVAYLFFASGVNNFGKLPILTENIEEVNQTDKPVILKDKITILGFLGNDLLTKKGNASNLNEKIYKRFFEFKDFQFVMVVGENNEEKIKELKKELGKFSDVSKWHFVQMTKNEISTYFSSLNTGMALAEDLSSPNVFIIDKDLNLRGRTDDVDETVKYGYNTSSVADLNNKMVDDVKIILAEYRLALKKNNATR
ncbi:hypothetical protein [Pseudozobellia sp. WGM2]|uniref:hypothetical protein n=1 Tax=Pseudozobellia sp. WGM2 TaxID=2787625 RepID=UPI001AE02921|nr:hypothetical protein [Pseudozobellia sp. WGM2]